jgi:flagellar basal body-associated protein FliL
MVQDAQGRYWALGTESGKWNVHDGTKWIEADPFASAAAANAPPPRPTDLPERARVSPARPAPTVTPPTPTPAPPPARSSGGCGGCLVRGCLLLIVLIVVLAVGGYLAFQSGAITTQTLLNLAGLGPAVVEVDNFRDDAIQVNLQQTDVAKDSTAIEGSLQLNPFDIKLFRTQTAGKYRVDFATTNGTRLGTCALTLRGSDHYQFVTLPERISVNRANNPSSVGADYVIDTSSLCR